MSYILGAIVVIMAAYIASLQGEITHYKTRIKSMNSRIGELLRGNLQAQETIEQYLHDAQRIRNFEGIKEMEVQK